MNKLHQSLALAALLSVSGALDALAMDHGSMDHGSMNHGSMSHGSMDHGSMSHGPAAGTHAAAPARHGVEIRKTVVSGYALAYHLIDMQEMMKSSSMPMTHGGEQMKSHHLMVYPVGPDGKPATGAKTGFFVVRPDKSDVKVMAMHMEDGFGADVDLKAKGEYRITTKIALGGTTLVDEFAYTVK